MTEAAPTLHRALSRRDLTGLMLNIMIASGMLAAPAKVFHIAGDWSLPVLGVAALMMAPMILVFCDLGSRFAGTGGPYLYARAALPAPVGFSVGWLLWISQVFSTSALWNVLISYLAGMVPAVGEGLPRTAVILALGITFTLVAVAGIRQSAAASNLLIAVKAVFLLSFVAIGLTLVAPEHLAIHGPPPSPIAFAQAILIYVFAFMGFERSGVMAGEARDPQRDVPVAMLVGLVLATLTYAGVLVVSVGVLGDPSATDRPLAEAGRQLFGGAGVAAVSAGAIAVILGALVVATIGVPRLLRAMVEQGQLPAVLGALHPRRRTPYVAILVSNGLAFGFAVGNDLLTILTFATAARVICYILCCVALCRLDVRPDAPQPLFSLPARRLVALAAAVIFAVVLALGSAKELPALSVALAVGLGLYVMTRLRRPAVQLP